MEDIITCFYDDGECSIKENLFEEHSWAGERNEIYWMGSVVLAYTETRVVHLSNEICRKTMCGSIFWMRVQEFIL